MPDMDNFQKMYNGPSYERRLLDPVNSANMKMGKTVK